MSPPNFADPFNGKPPALGDFLHATDKPDSISEAETPTTQDWDLNLQSSVRADLLFEIGYVGTKGTRLPRFIEANPAMIRSWNRRWPADFEFQQCRSTTALFRLHTR